MLGDNALPMHRSARRVASLLCGFAAASSLAGAELLPETELVSNCYNFPESIFGLDNSIKATYGASPHLLIPLGDPAVDFTLHDTDGNRWNLGEVLEAGQGKPVVLIFGMRSCPAYEGLVSGEDSTNKWAYWHERALVSVPGVRGETGMGSFVWGAIGLVYWWFVRSFGVLFTAVPQDRSDNSLVRNVMWHAFVSAAADQRHPTYSIYEVRSTPHQQSCT